MLSRSPIEILDRDENVSAGATAHGKDYWESERASKHLRADRTGDPFHITMDSPAGPLIVGDQRTYSVAVENLGDLDGYNVVTTHSTPPGFEFVSFSGSGADSSNGLPAYRLGMIPAGDSLQYGITFKVVSSSADETELANAASVKGDTGVLVEASSTASWSRGDEEPTYDKTFAPMLFTSSPLHMQFSGSYAASASAGGGMANATSLSSTQLRLDDGDFILEGAMHSQASAGSGGSASSSAGSSSRITFEVPMAGAHYDVTWECDPSIVVSLSLQEVLTSQGWVEAQYSAFNSFWDYDGGCPEGEEDAFASGFLLGRYTVVGERTVGARYEFLAVTGDASADSYSHTSTPQDSTKGGTFRVVLGEPRDLRIQNYLIREDGGVDVTVKAKGYGESTTAEVGLYWSSDLEFSSADAPAGSLTTSLEPDVPKTLSFAGVVTNDPPAPVLLVVVDPNEQVIESFEDDNVRAIQAPKPDISVTSARVTHTGTVDFLVRTDCFEPLSTEFALYQSEDEVFDESEDVLVESWSEDLEPGLRNLSFSATAEYDPNSRYLFVIADPNELIDESAESNNRQRLLAPSLDLEVRSAELNGGQVDFSVWMTGFGVAPVEMGLYKSADSVFDEDDTPIKTAEISMHAGIMEETFSGVPEYDPDFPYLFVVADPAGKLDESSEFNNRRHVLPDLRVVDARLDYQGNVEYLVEATGFTGQLATAVSLYRSTDDSFSAGDEYVTSVITLLHPGFERSTPPGGPDDQLPSFSGPIDNDPSQPFLLVVIDRDAAEEHDNLVPESDEENNVRKVSRPFCERPLTEYKDNGTPCVYRRGNKFQVHVEHYWWEEPKLVITDPRADEGETKTSVARNQEGPEWTIFTIDVPPDNPVGIYEFDVFLEPSVGELPGDDQATTPTEPAFSREVYIIFDVPESLGPAEVDTYLYSEDGNLDDESYAVGYLYPDPRKVPTSVLRRYVVKTEEHLTTDPVTGLPVVKPEHTWFRYWAEHSYRLEPFDSTLFQKVIYAVDGEGTEVAVASGLMDMVSNMIEYNKKKTNKAGSVPAMFKDVKKEEFRDAFLLTEKPLVQGQCLDYAHALAAFMRSMGIPARTATKISAENRHHGYDYHRWTEAYLDPPPEGQDPWYTYDAMDDAGEDAEARGGDSRMNAEFGPGAFEVVVGGPSWEPDGMLELQVIRTDPATGDPYYALRPEVGAPPERTADALLEKLAGHYDRSGADGYDPPESSVVSLSLDDSEYRPGDTAIVTAHITNRSPEAETFDVAWRLFRRDIDDMSDVLNGETLLADSDSISIPGNTTVDVHYGFPINDASVPYDLYAVHVTATSESVEDRGLLVLPVIPAYDLSVDATSQPMAGDPIVVTATLTNAIQSPILDVSLSLDVPGFFATEDSVQLTIPSIRVGDEQTFAWTLTPIRQDMPMLQYFNMSVTSTNGGNEDAAFSVLFDRPPTPVVRLAASPFEVEVGEAFPIVYEIQNIGSAPLLENTVTLDVPFGVSVTEPLSRSIGDLGPGGSAVLEWNVQSYSAGLKDFTMTVQDATEAYSDSLRDFVQVVPPSPPEVVNIRVSGQAWNADVEPYSLIDTSDPGRPLPWVNVDQIEVEFSQNVEVSMESLTLTGADGAEYSPSDFTHAEGTPIVTWTFGTPFGIDELLLNLAGEPTDDHPIDGLTGLLGGGNDFELRFDVTPGDVAGYGVVTVTDLANIGDRLGSTVGPPATASYDPLFDVNGDGAINETDLTETAARIVSTAPGELPSPATPSASYVLETNAPPGSPILMNGASISANKMLISIAEETGSPGAPDDLVRAWQTTLSIVPGVAATGSLGFITFQSPANYILDGRTTYGSVWMSPWGDTLTAFDTIIDGGVGEGVPSSPGSGLTEVRFVASADALGVFDVVASPWPASEWTDSASDIREGAEFSNAGSNGVVIGQVFVGAANDAPVATDDDYGTDEGTSLSVPIPGVLGNDEDVDGDALTAVLAGDVSNGTLTLNDDGSFLYEPDDDWNGTDSFTYQAQDPSLALSNLATVTITVGALNDAPVATDDDYGTDEGTSLSVPLPGVLGNDDDVDGDALTAVLASDVSNGTLTLNDDGSFLYEPDDDWNGIDSFTYQAQDPSLALSNLATVTITVGAVNDAPVATNDDYGTDEGTPLSIPLPGVLGNDDDVDGDALTAVLASDVSNGTLTLNDDGSFLYEPDDDWSGTDSFTYQAQDPSLALSNIATVTITVGAVNDAPVATDDNYGTDEGTSLSVPLPGLLGNDDDDDVDGDALTAVLASDVSNGTLTLNDDGSFLYEPDDDWNGIDSFTYQAQDSSLALSNIATVTITVGALNDAPVATDDNYGTDEGTSLSVLLPGVLGNDDDVDGDVLTAVLVSDVSNGTLTLNADGSLLYTPDADWNGTDSFTYQARDPDLVLSVVVTVTLTVNAVNDAPAAADDTYTTDEDTPLSVPLPGVLGNDDDVDGDALAAVLVSDVSNGTLTLSDDGSFLYTPDADWNGTDSFTYQAGDPDLALSEEATVTIVVRAVNDPPVADPNGPYTVVEGSSVVLDGSESSDPDQSNASLIFEWDFDYDGAAFDVTATGISPTFDAFGLEGPLTLIVALRVTDTSDASDIETTELFVEESQPTEFTCGPPAAGTAGNVFLQCSGPISVPGETVDLPLQITPDEFTLAGGFTRLALELTSPDGSLDPAPVAVQQASGTAVVPFYNTSDVAGSDSSLILVQLGFGDYTMSVGAEDSATGNVTINVILLGDLDGDHRVTRGDNTAIRRLLGASVGDARYQREADSDLDGDIDTFDYLECRRNISDAVSMFQSPMMVAAVAIARGASDFKLAAHQPGLIVSPVVTLSAAIGVEPLSQGLIFGDLQPHGRRLGSWEDESGHRRAPLVGSEYTRMVDSLFATMRVEKAIATDERLTPENSGLSRRMALRSDSEIARRVDEARKQARLRGISPTEFADEVELESLEECLESLARYQAR